MLKANKPSVQHTKVTNPKKPGEDPAIRDSTRQDRGEGMAAAPIELLCESVAACSRHLTSPQHRSRASGAKQSPQLARQCWPRWQV